MSDPSGGLVVGQRAPNFDLGSTSGCVLMLRDELARTPVLLYVFATGAPARSDLQALGAAWPQLQAKKVRVLGLAPAPLAELEGVRRELDLPFPLLADDRGFHRHYGLSVTAGEAARPALFLIDRNQAVTAAWCPLTKIDTALATVLAGGGVRTSPLASYPRRVLNRWVERWVA